MASKLAFGAQAKPHYSTAEKIGLFGATLRDVGAGLAGQQGNALATAQQALTGQQQRAAQQAALQQVAQSITDPQEAAVFNADPDTWFKIYGERMKPMLANQGQTLLQNGKPVVSIAKTGIDGGYGYSQGQDGQVTWNGAPRPMSYSEGTALAGQVETARNNRVQNQLGFGNLGVAQGNLGVNRGRLTLGQAVHEARLKSGGYGTPGVGQVLGPSLGSDWEVQ